MQSSIGLAAMLLLSAFPATAQVDASVAWTEVATDSEGDVSYILADQQSAPAVDPHGRADLTFLHIAESSDALIFSVGVVNMDEFPSGSGQWLDAASLDIRFKIGELFYNVRTGAYQDGQPFGEVRGGQTDYSEPILETNMAAELNGATFTIEVQRDLLRDHNGAPVQTGMELTELHIDSHVHATGLFLQNPDGSLLQPLGIRDRMPDAGTANFAVRLGGPVSDGSMELAVPTPFRASNGGEATITYQFQVTNTAETDATFTIDTVGIPAAWGQQHASSISVPAGQTETGHMAIHTPSGHQHGGTQQFVLNVQHANDPDTRATAILGVLYLAIPQPSGHHPTLWFHSTPWGEPGRTLGTVNGGTNGELRMNTMQDDEIDQQVTVQGWTGGFTGSDFRWSICMTPELLLGIDVNMTQTGTATIPLSSERSFEDVVVSGRVLHVSAGEEFTNCWFGNYADRTQTEIATLVDSVPQTVSGNTVFDVTVAPHADGDFLPFEAGSMLILEVFASPGGPANVAGPQSIQLAPGGEMTLPLDEFHDALPQGFIGFASPEPTTELDLPAPADIKESPAPTTFMLLGVLVIAALRRQ